MDDIPQPIPPGSPKLMDVSALDKAFYFLSQISQPTVYGRNTEELVFKYAKPTRRLPSVLSHGEIQQIFAQMSGTPKLMVQLLCRLQKSSKNATNFRIWANIVKNY